MFDIGFSELVVIGVVALVVLGPERLPKVARTAGHLFGRFQRYVAGVKVDIAREMELDELRKFKSEMENGARSFESTIQQEVSLAEQEIRTLERETQKITEAVTVGLHDKEGTNRTGEIPEPIPEHDPTPSPQMELALDAAPAPKRSDR